MAKIIDNFILIEPLGSGRFSETLKGRNLISKAPVAVKTIKLDQFLNNQPLREMVINEIQLLKRLEHPSLVQMLKMLKSSNNIYLIYEYLSGGPLSGYISKNSPINPEKRLVFFKQMLEAVSAVHKEEIVHNNISSETFFLNEDRLKLKNFMLARPAAGNKKPIEPELWRFAAPEVLQGGCSGYKSDVWSLGMVLFELISGEPVINCPNEPEKVLDAVNQLDISQNDPIFGDLLAKMLKTNESERISLEEVVSLMNSSINSVQNTMPSQNPPLNPQKPNRLEKLMVKERQKVQFLVQNINKLLTLEPWPIDFSRNLLVFYLLKSGLIGLESLQALFPSQNQPETSQNPAIINNFLINSQGIDLQELKSFSSSDFGIFFSTTVATEAQNLREVIAKYLNEPLFQGEVIGEVEERDILKGLFGFASQVYELIAREKENNRGQEVWDEETRKEQGVMANYMLDVIFFKEFFENFIRNEGRLGEQKYFRHVESVGVEKLQGMLEKKLAYARKQLNL